VYGLIQLGYQVALAALTTGILLKGTWAMRRTICTVFAVMAAAWSLSGLWPSVAYSLAMIAIDAIACIVITWHPAGRWQSVVGLSYILQIGVHIGRVFNGDNADLVSFWWGLSILAVLQMFLVGGWWIDGLDLPRRWRDTHPRAGKARHPGVG
jgi:hypothetical protein